MNTPMTRIVAAVVDVRNLTLYKEDGSTIVIPQGDPRLRRIVDEAAPQLIKHGWADVRIEQNDDNSYAKFEKEGSGAVKFFRIAKAKLKNLFTPVIETEPANTAPVPVLSIGAIPEVTMKLYPVASATPALDHIATAGIHDVSEEDEVDAAIEEADQVQAAKAAAPTKLEQTQATINEIMQHAVPVSSEEFHERDIGKQGNVVESAGHTIKVPSEYNNPDTIIAVVDGKVVPGMEHIKTQFSRAVKMGSTVGVENFLKRIAAVIEQRSHSVEDLLKFMERGDMPIADDGSILIFKVLKKSLNKGTHYVDCHSKKVEQFIGAYVCMDPSMVDRNRNNECSNGLHVARRGYIKEFSGDVCVLAKLAPEDVITVPSYDANKMRVCGYHILFELTPGQYTALCGNRPFTDVDDGKQLLAKALTGQHISRTHEVRITQSMGGGVVTTKLRPVEQAVQAEAVAPIAGVEALENPETEKLDKPTDPKDVVKQVEQLSRKEQAKILYDACAGGGEEALEKLRAFKKASKISWSNLGLPDLNGSTFSIPTPDEETTKQAMSGKAFNRKSKKVAQVKKKLSKSVAEVKAALAPPKTKTPKLFPAKAVVESPAPTQTKADVIIPPQEFKAPPVPPKPVRVPASRIVNEVETGLGSPRSRIQKMLEQGSHLTSIGAAQAVLDIKKASKKSWEYLGVSDAQLAAITKLAKQGKS